MELQRNVATIQALGGVVLAVSLEQPAVARRGAQELHLTFPLLHDTDHRLGLAFDDFVVDPVQPMDADAIFILDAQGRVQWKRRTNEFLLSGSEVIAALRRA